MVQELAKGKEQLSKAFQLGFVCVFTYVINYYIRNLLGVLTPAMEESGVYTKTYLALLASVYMIVYAAGQLLNGIIGDHIKPKIMVSLGLIISSAGLFLFSFVNNSLAGVIGFGTVGFGLSMLRGPLVKVISENTLPKYARVCCVFLSFASFAGPLLAGLAAMAMNWYTVFVFSAFVLLAMALLSFTMLTVFEKKGMIVPLQVSSERKKGKIDILALFSLLNFIPYLIVAMVVEIAAASINYWMPSYFSEALMLTKDASNMTFSAISLLRALCPFISLFIFKLLKERDILIIRIFFSAAAILLLAVYFIKTVWLSIVLFTLALMCSSVSSATLWSIYIPSLGKSGKVSSANGVIDCTGYVAASLCNVAVVPIMENFGWGGTIISWSLIMLVGVLGTVFAKTNRQEI